MARFGAYQVLGVKSQCHLEFIPQIVPKGSLWDNLPATEQAKAQNQYEVTLFIARLGEGQRERALVEHKLSS